MIIVAGTKRSGTSMWMQILIAAGLPAFGEAFPRNWGETIREANPSGFYESMLRMGIYYGTNPHPVTGAYFFPEQVERHVVKCFIPGLVRSDRAFVGKVVATMRPWRQYERSLTRLYDIEHEKRLKSHPDAPRPLFLPPHLEWWAENFMLVRDIAIRRYPVHVQSYTGLLTEPAAVIEKTLRWLFRDAEEPLKEAKLEQAIAAVKPEHRTQHEDQSSESIEPEFQQVFDDLYEAVDAGAGLSPALIRTLNATNERLLPRIRETQRELARQRGQRLRAGPGGNLSPDDLQSMQNHEIGASDAE